MAINWGSFDSHLRVGIEIIMSPSSVSAGTTSVDLKINYYVGNDDIGYDFDDDQTLTISGSITGTYSFHNSLSTVNDTQLVKTRTISNVATKYGDTTDYTFGASISGAFNSATPSKTQAFSVPARPANPPNAPGTPSVSNIAVTTATITWAAPSTNGASVTNYQIQLDNNSSFSSPSTATPVGTGRSFGLTGMAPASTYYVRVRANSSAGYGPWSTTRSLVTLNYPSAPSVPSISALGPDTATATWNTPSNGGNGINSYTVQIADNSSFSGASAYTLTATSKVFSGLDPAQSYFVRVRATNDFGDGAWSPVATFTTLAGAKVSNGSAEYDCPVYVYDGSAFQPSILQIYNGSSFQVGAP
jgi:hypothetical protein